MWTGPAVGSSHGLRGLREELVKMAKWEMGQLVHIRYSGGIKGEEPIDIRRSESLPVILGAGQIPVGIERELFDMEIGETRTIEFPPDLGYGERIEKNCYWQPRTLIPNGYQWHVGDVLNYTHPETGEHSLAWVLEEREDVILVDHNHPFAGRTLVYEVELVSASTRKAN